MDQAKSKIKKNKKSKKWTKFRHRVVTVILHYTFGIYCKIRYRIRIDRFREQEKRPYLILLNHQTAFDQFFVGMAFRGPVYYLASEDIFSNGWVSSLIRWLVEPIPIKKQTTDVRAILNCIKVAKEGGTIAIAPEGNRTYSGRTEYMSPSIVPLAKKLNMPIALFRIEGGYGVHPRWSDVVRKGKMHAYVSRVIAPEEYASMSDAELFAIIEKGLYVDEARVDGEYKHKSCAEYLERAIYVCPDCGLSTFESNGDVIACKKCEKQIRYKSTKELEGIGFELPFRFAAQWYDYQCDFINSYDPAEHGEELLYMETASVSEVIPCKTKVLMCENAEISMYGSRLTVDMNGELLEFAFSDTAAVTVLGKNKLNVYHGDKIYQIKGSKRFNALKYVHMYNRYKNVISGEKDVKFLGL